jgi:hypothetical protein
MEVGPLLFVMFLLSLGVLLIMIFRRGLKEQALHQERLTTEARNRQYAAMRAARRQMQPPAPHTAKAPAPSTPIRDEALKPNP